MTEERVLDALIKAERQMELYLFARSKTPKPSYKAEEKSKRIKRQIKKSLDTLNKKSLILGMAVKPCPFCGGTGRA